MKSSNKYNRRSFLKYSLSLAAGGSAIALLTPQLRIGERLLYLLNSPDVKPVKDMIASMGTFVSIAIYDHRDLECGPIMEQALEEFRAVNRLMSTFNSNSLISLVNRNAGIESVSVDSRIYEVVTAAKKMGEKSKGIFDPTILPLLKAYGFRDKNPHLPDEKTLEKVLSLVDYNKIHLNKEKNEIGLETAGSEIDLGGIAKGYAVDRAVEVLRFHGVRKAVVNAGGDIYALGSPKEDEGWLIGIQHPFYSDRLAAKVRVSNQAIATSGNYENFITVREDKLGHLLDPFSGMPADLMLSATITAPTAMEADAFATTLFLMEKEEGLAFIGKEPDAEGIIIAGHSGKNPEFKTTEHFPDWEIL